MDVFTGESFHRIWDMPQLDSLEALPEKSLLLVRDVEIRHDSVFAARIKELSPEIKKGSFSLYIVGKEN